MTKTRKMFAALLAIAIAVSALICPASTGDDNNLGVDSIVQTIEAEAVNYGRAYDQENWSTATTLGKQLQGSGCGIFSLANAIYALNGKNVDITNVAEWAKNNTSWCPGNGGLYRTRFYGNDLSSGNVASKYGDTYNFKIDGCYYGKISDSRLKEHLQNGGVAVVHVYQHFMAVTAYNGDFYTVESYPTSTRGLDAASWVSASKLASGKTNVDWYCLISSKSTVTTTATTAASECFKKYTGNSGSIVTALNSIGVDSSYNYRKKIAAANDISNYAGTASQNTALLNKLKAGTLKKPGSVATTTTVTYFKKYTGSSGSIVTALNAIGADSSYSYRKKIAQANGISNYSGTASQNTTLLKKLKNGTLKKP